MDGKAIRRLTVTEVEKYCDTYSVAEYDLPNEFRDNPMLPRVTFPGPYARRRPPRIDGLPWLIHFREMLIFAVNIEPVQHNHILIRGFHRVSQIALQGDRWHAVTIVEYHPVGGVIHRRINAKINVFAVRIAPLAVTLNTLVKMLHNNILVRFGTLYRIVS